MPVFARIHTDPEPGQSIVVRVWAWITGAGGVHVPKTEPYGSNSQPADRQRVDVHAEWVSADFNYVANSATGTPTVGAHSLDWTVELLEDGPKQEFEFRLNSHRDDEVSTLTARNQWTDSGGTSYDATERLDHRIASDSAAAGGGNDAAAKRK